MPLDAGDFRLMDRKVVNELNRLPEKSRYIRGLVNWVGFKQKGLLYERDKRFAGETKFSLSKMLRFALDGITGFSDKPLHMAAYLGSAFAAVALLGVIWVFGSYIFGREHLVTGWASIMIVIFTIGAIQLFALSVIGQYISRIHKEARDRPLFIVQDVLDRQDGTRLESELGKCSSFNT
jgi:dolichol-phosphate mannosyltransferase